MRKHTGAMTTPEGARPRTTLKTISSWSGHGCRAAGCVRSRRACGLAYRGSQQYRRWPRPIPYLFDVGDLVRFAVGSRPFRGGVERLFV